MQKAPSTVCEVAGTREGHPKQTVEPVWSLTLTDPVKPTNLCQHEKQTLNDDLLFNNSLFQLHATSDIVGS